MPCNCYSRFRGALSLPVVDCTRRLSPNNTSPPTGSPRLSPNPFFLSFSLQPVLPAAYSSSSTTLKKEAASCYEMFLTDYQLTRRHITEDCNLHQERCKTLWYFACFSGAFHLVQLQISCREGNVLSFLV